MAVIYNIEQKPMKTKHLLTTKILVMVSLFISVYSLSAQDTLTNQGFERWEKSGKAAPFDWSEPQGWSSSNPLTEFITAGISQIQIPQSGSQQAQIKSLLIFGQTIPGVLINGDFTLNISDTANFPLVGGEPFTTVKTKLYGMYNFSVTDTADSATVTVAFKKFNSTSNKPEAVAIGTIILPQTNAGLHPFVVNIQQINAQQPDSVVVTLLSSKNGNFKNGGTLIIDYVGFDKPLAVIPSLSTTKKTIVYPTPTSNMVTIKAPTKGFSYIIFDVFGKTQLMGNSTSNFAILDINDFKSGMYYVQIQTGKTEVLKFIKTD